MGLEQELLAGASVAGRVCVGLVFVLAAVQKTQHWRIFSGVVANYRLLPDALVAPAAWLLPPVEMLVGILLLSAQLEPLGAMAAIVLLSLFAAAMAINLKRGRSHIDCGCGRSILKQSLSWVLVGRNAGLAVLLLPSLIFTRPMAMTEALTGVAAGSGFFLLYLLLNVFAALPPVEAHRQRFA
ncbi:MAG TPA: MauE/DoxX family redox-associated membrane protein [Rhizomicrobium sp.]|nr:MauE/DoxX family redox-associated membrane protein [Rhizomicrobium sp.]